MNSTWESFTKKIQKTIQPTFYGIRKRVLSLWKQISLILTEKLFPKILSFFKYIRQNPKKSSLIFGLILLPFLVLRAGIYVFDNYLQCPQVVSISPAAGDEEVSLKPSITLSFSEEMAKASVEQALTVLQQPAPVENSIQSTNPTLNGLDAALNDLKDLAPTDSPQNMPPQKTHSKEVAGTISWDSPSTLTFTPNESLSRSTLVTVRLTKEARAKNSRGLAKDYTSAFTTIAHPQVAFASPTGNTQEPAEKIVLMFSKSMQRPDASGATPKIDLTTSANYYNDEIASFITISPEIEGTGKWVGSAAYLIEPENLEKGMKYTVSLNQDLKSLDGGVLKKGYSFEFTNFVPAVLYAEGDLGGVSGGASKPSDINPQGPITFYFNQAIDRQSLLDNFTFTEKATKEAVPYRAVFSNRTSADNKSYYYNDWEEQWQQKVDFYPVGTLKPLTEYSARVNSGFLGYGGNAPAPTEYAYTFETADAPGFNSISLPKGQGKFKDGQEISYQDNLNLNFNSPMDGETLEKHLSLTALTGDSPGSVEALGYTRSRGKTFVLNRYLKPSTTYRLTIPAGTPDRYGRAIGATHTFEFTTKPYEIAVTMNTGYSRIKNFSDNLDTRVITRVTNADKLTYNLYSLTTSEFQSLATTCQYSLGSINRAWLEKENITLEGSWDTPLDLNLNVPTDVLFSFERDAKKDLDPGFYYLDVLANDGKDYTGFVFAVTNTAVTVKDYQDGFFVWAASLDNRDVREGNTVKVFKDPEMCRSLGITHDKNLLEPVKTGVTNSDGVWWQKEPLIGDYSFVLVEKGDQFGVSLGSWHEGIAPHQFDEAEYGYTAASYGALDYKGFIVTDKTLYRPGNELNFNAFVRRNTPTSFDYIADSDASVNSGEDGTPESATPGLNLYMQLEKRYSSDAPIYTHLFENVTDSIKGTVQLPEDLTPGAYILKLQFTKNVASSKDVLYTADVRVEEYKVPEFEVTVQGPAKEVIHGQNVSLQAKANYFYGAPLSGRPLDYRLYKRKYVFNPSGLSGYSFYSSKRYFGDDLVWRGFEEEKVSSGSGTTDNLGVFSYGVNTSGDSGMSKIYTFEADVTGESGKRFTGTTEFVAHMAEHYTGVKPLSYVGVEGEESEFAIKTVDVFAEDKAGIPATVNVYNRKYFRVKTKDNEGSSYYKTSYEDTLVTSDRVTTDDQGDASYAFMPSGGGLHIIEVVSTDSVGNVSAADTTFYVASRDSGYWKRENHDRVKLILDKEEYSIGDTAEIITTSTLEEPLVLLTVEAEGVLDYKIARPDSSADLMKLLVKDVYAPNAYVNALLVAPGTDVYNPPEFRMGVKVLNVDVTDHLLNVDIEPGEEGYAPGDSGTATITVTDKEGNPVAAANLTLALVDDALLTMSPVKRRNAFNHFYSKRFWGVNTTQTLTASWDRVNANTELGAKGGSGAKGGAGGDYIDLTRENFSDVAHWEVDVTTDASGKAVIDFELPDSITRWNLLGLARTSDGFGQAVFTFTASLDSFALSALPRFVRSTDKFDLGLVVHNNTEVSRRYSVKALAPDLVFSGASSSVVDVAGGSEQKISFPVEVPARNDLEAVNITFEVYEGDVLVDRLGEALEVYLYGLEVVESFSNNVKNVAYEVFTIEDVADTRFGSVKASVFGAPLTMAEDIADEFLEEDPCETSLSLAGELLVNLHIYKYKKEVESSDEGVVQSYADKIEKTIYSLEDYRLSDGGWGYTSRSRESSTYVTSQVLVALSGAQEVGFSVDSVGVERAANYLNTKLIEVQHFLPDQAAMIAFALSSVGRDTSGTLSYLYNRRSTLKDVSKGYMILAMKAQGGKWGKYVDQLKSDLLQSADLASQRIFWNYPEAVWFYGNDMSTTAVILRAFNKTDPDSLVADLAVNHLLQGEASYFANYSDALRVAALLENGLARGVKFRPSDVRVVVGEDADSADSAEAVEAVEAEILSGTLNFKEGRSSVFGEIPLSDLSAGEKRAQIKLVDGGSAYYSLVVNKILPFDQIVADSEGIGIVREYFDLQGNKVSPLNFEVGESYAVRLTLAVPNLRRHVVVEDYFPAGLEGVNDTLENESRLGPSEFRDSVSEGASKGFPFYASGFEMYPDSMRLLLDYLPAGVYEYVYLVKASVPGEYRLRPAQAFESHSPDVRGNGMGGSAVVR
ncbi:hypothetical protein GF360_04280 [candidate division WWE3 bacterium]|nr:hypothetical protein [candidate division WWE3 bacterium]